MRARPAWTTLPSLAIAALCLRCPALAAGVLYVDASQDLPEAAQDGGSWATAYASLTAALAASADGDEIWVAGGTYTPTTGTNRFARFNLKSGVRLYGGFHGGDSSLDQRDIAGNPSILSGEIGDPALTTDNSLRVVAGFDLSESTLLDGFVIRDASADTFPFHVGGGLGLGGLGGGAVAIRRCTFVDNFASHTGGAVTSSAPARFIECTFLNNVAGVAVGALDLQLHRAEVVNCRFLGNVAADGGAGALRVLNGTETSRITGCFFSGNQAHFGGGAIDVAASDAAIVNCTIVACAVTLPTQQGGGILTTVSGTTVVANTIIRGNTAGGLPDQAASLPGTLLTFVRCNVEGLAPDGDGNFGSDPLFRGLAGDDGLLGTADDDPRLLAASPCIDRADFSHLPKDIADLDGDGNVDEPLSLDLLGGARAHDALTIDTGIGGVSHLDLGAAEFRRPGTVICVHPEGEGASGLTWEEAVKDIHSGFALAAQPRLEPPVQVWVAAGTYKPTETADRSASFVHPGSGVAVFGGFAGGELSLLERDPAANPTILSGAIGAAGSADNSFHVIDFTGDTYSRADVLDGFVITAGNAHGDPSGAHGGGIRIRSDALPTIRNCRIVGNQALLGGGVGSIGNGAGVLVNCLVSGNDATAGGGVYSESALEIRNCTIVANASESGGAGIFAVGPSVTSVLNSVLHGNVDGLAVGELAQIAFEKGPALEIAFSLIECFGQSGRFDGATESFGGDPRFVGTAGPDGLHGTSDDSGELLPFSPCIDAGKNGAMGDDAGDSDEDGVAADEKCPFDLRLASRFHDDAGLPDAGGAKPTIDVGAFEFQGTSTGVPPHPADLNGDGRVNGADLGLLLGSFGTVGSAGPDVNGDCVVDGSDLGLVLGAWTG
ncbi:MAG TPA: right-handed parallel beta-helix repeat-containing protein [Phycisphaerales bacterium]|nr:right-handed parallel beta-helix repeat-containing protein [Phycisphaerales bacterium]HMP37802.1 right-handed parallel beta-helix repeat-containing protein [Phycisphaerales bacterium]